MIAYDRLSLIIPPDQALANKALQAALQQLTGISGSNLTEFGAAVASLETTKNLPLVQAETTPLPASVYNYYINNFTANLGTGPNGTITYADVIGAPAGLPYTAQFQIIRSQVATSTSDGALSALITLYNQMLNTVNGVYGYGPVIIPSGPAAGTYTDFNSAFDGAPMQGAGLVPSARSAINTFIAANPTATTTLNNASNTIAAALVRQANNQNTALLSYGDLSSNDRLSMLSFITNLSVNGLDTSQDNATEILQNVADTSTLGGQALVAALREARNVITLNNAGIETATQLSPDPATPPPQISLADGRYTESEAKNQIIF
jgi:hypothetical protein